MAAYLTCQSLSGLPLFIRRKGDIPALPFPIVASLNGVHTYIKTQGGELVDTCSENVAIIWKEYHDTLVLCLAASDTTLSTDHLRLLLDVVFHTLVLYEGLEDLLNLRNVERLKKDLKVCYPVIDMLLDSLAPQEDWEDFCDITHCTDVMVCAERHTFEGILNCFSESVGTVFGCLRIHGKIAAATSNWWTLDKVELLLIQLLLYYEKDDLGIDIPIYLPIRSPKIPFRLVRWRLTQSCEVALLCGPTPSVDELEHEAKRFWKTAYTLLKSAESSYPANIPQDIVLDKNVLSYLIVNTEKRRSLSSLSPYSASSGDAHSHLTSVRKRDILRNFYRTAVGTMIKFPESGDAKASSAPQELFMNFEYYSLHALLSDCYLVMILYPSGLHNFFMRSITRSTLKTLTCEKNCKW